MVVYLQLLRMFRMVVLFLLLPSTMSTHYRLLVLHTNDMHSRFDQIDATGAECVVAEQPCYGGFARLKTAVDQKRRLADTGTVDGSLFLNAGDTFQGSAFYTLLKWQAVERMVRTLGIDVMVSPRSWYAITVVIKYRGMRPVRTEGYIIYIIPM